MNVFIEKIKFPLQYNADDLSVRDANFKLIARIGGEGFLSVPEIDKMGNWMTRALNVVADHERTTDDTDSECPRCALIGQLNTIPCPLHD